MFSLRPLLTPLLVTLLSAFALVCAARAQDISAAPAVREIVNVAEARWQAGSDELTRLSNRVSIPTQDSSGTGFSIAPLRLGDGPKASPRPVARPMCQGSAGQISVPLDDAALNAGDQPKLMPTADIRGGEPLYFSITFPGANTDPGKINSLTGVIESRDGKDREILTIYETGANTGVFVGVVQTRLSPPVAVQGDCVLTVEEGDVVSVASLATRNGFPLVRTQVNVLVDPYGFAFDSEDGSAVDGVSVTLIDEATGQPARVKGSDGVSDYPSTVLTGAPVTDAGGHFYPGIPGDYRFPFVAQGRYRLVVQPPAPYTAPSAASPQVLAALRRPDGQRVEIGEGSYGRTIIIDRPEPVRVDIPLDRPRVAASVTKVADRGLAAPGDLVIYTVTVRNPDTLRPKRGLVLVDTLPGAMRLRRDTVRVDGRAMPDAVKPSPDGGTLTVDLGTVPPGAARVVRYALEVRLDARDGVAVNRARTRDTLGTESPIAESVVRISRETIADRMTIIGRVIAGNCGLDPDGRPGLRGVRVLLEDGSYAITDADGRYHFEGVVPGVHVVAIEPSTLPAGTKAVDCASNTRSGGSAVSRFVEGSGGSLHRADFRIALDPDYVPSAGASSRPATPAAVASDKEAAGGEEDWFADNTPGIDWLYPRPDTNPRAPAVRIVIKYLPGQKVTLFAGGKPVDPVTYDGEKTNAERTISVSLWRGVPLGETDTRFTAEVRNADGSLAKKLERHVAFVAQAADAVVLRDQSVLVADGITKPVITLRITDRQGRPVHHGLTGDIQLPAPYAPAVEADAEQARQLAGMERPRAQWRVEGDDGIARVMLEPTTVSGALGLVLPFSDGRTTRQRRIDLWLDPGDRPWTLVGLAEGTLGYTRLKQGLEPAATSTDPLSADGRIALFARGRVRGKWLMTLAYDSKKRESETRFGGTIDPDTYYTVYADQSERRFGAASVRKLYLKLERPQFYALFGDYDTGINEPVLARYVRSFNGIKAEYRSARVSALGFAADAPSRHRRDELQGTGLSGPYQLGARDLLANSETIAIETRDRLRGDRLVDRRLLTRHIDYDIDYGAGTLRFREPVLSRSSSLDPQIIVADYEVNGVGRRSLNAGGRATATLAGGKLRIGATGIRDADDLGATSLGGADLRYRPDASTEIRAEAAASIAEAGRGSGTSIAYLVEAERHSQKLDLLAYVRQEGAGFGIGQTARTTQARRTIGFEGSMRLSEPLTISGAAWHEQSLGAPASRIAARALAEYRTSLTDFRAGVTFAQDHRVDGVTAQSTIVQLGATRRLFDNRLELDAQTEFALGKAASVDFPARQRVSARFALTKSVRLSASYERARGDKVKADTLRVGVDLQPWSGARLTSAIGQQGGGEYGPRAFAAYGLAQTIAISSRWSVDFSVDGNRTLSGIDPASVINPAQPVASGGQLTSDGGITEDFVAITGGATYRGERWSAAARAEYRTGSLTDRYAVTASLLRRIGEGRALGALLTVAHAEDRAGQVTETANLALSWAHRPSTSRFSWFDKLEARSDLVRGAVLGQPGPIGGAPLGISGDVASRRIINSLSLNYSAKEHRGSEWLDRSEISLFWGSRYVDTRFGDADVSGWSNIVALETRFDLNSHIDIGVAASTRLSTGSATVGYAVGPSIGLRPFKNGWLVIGYNIAGFDDRDFAAARSTRQGVYASFRLKFDNGLLADLGLQK